jgi:hypothetical protein
MARRPSARARMPVRLVWEDGAVARTSSRFPARTAAAVDAAALAAFVVVGVIQHDEGLALAGLLRTAVPLLVAWFAVALVVGTYRRPGWATLALTWAIAVPLGLVTRSVIRGGPWGRGLLIFGGVAMAFTLLFLAAGRSLLWIGVRIGRREGARAA